MRSGRRFGLVLGCAVGFGTAAIPHAEEPLPTDDGYHGIWYFNQPSHDEYQYKYSGGMATYPHQHIPIAVYAPAVRKTFFVYGGTSPEKRNLLHMVSYYDHVTGKVPRPRILLDKKTDDAHDNPVLQIDEKGYLWIFSNSHGTSRPSYIHRSVRPYDITAFTQVQKTNFSYGQPWHVPGLGFLFLHTRYTPDHDLFWMTSPDGKTWSEPHPLAQMEMGQYQVSWRDGDRIGTAFNVHPHPGGLNARTNLYYLETGDFGKTWKRADGKPVTVPVTDAANPALVHEYRSAGLLVYLKDLQFDGAGRPVILYLTSRGYESGPKNDPRTWQTARWTGETWEIRPFTTSDSNYDLGPLYVEPDGTWRIIAPTEPGPQPYNPGGELVLWLSRDQGATWAKTKVLTKGSPFNHTFVRRPWNAHPDFYAFWGDGNGRAPSACRLYFCDREGTRVRRLPDHMTEEFAEPEEIR